MIDCKSFRGSYLLYRKAGNGMVRVTGDRGGQAPRFRHPDRDSAVSEATRLLGKHPNSTFLILQEVGRVKMTESIGSDVVCSPARHSA